MTKIFTLASILLLSAAWLQAQQYPNSGSTHTNSGKNKVVGCLAESNGGYVLTSTDGTVYHLQGDDSKLSAHVGHEVQLTGTTSAAGAGSAMSGSTSASGGDAAQQPTFQVQSLKHISKTCKTSSSK